MWRYALRDDQWVRIEGLLPGRVGHVGMTARDNRLFVEAVLHRYRAGIPWRDLPERFGSWKAVHTRCGRWAKGGVWERVLRHLASDADTEYAMLDSTVVLSEQLRALVRENRADLAPALDRLRGVSEVLRKNKDNLDASLLRLAPFVRVFADNLGNGRWFDTLVENFADPADAAGFTPGCFGKPEQPGCNSEPPNTGGNP